MSDDCQPTTILIVEDEAVVRDVLVTELEEVGYKVIAVDSGEEALSILQNDKQQIDWLFTDIRLPGVVDGWRVADEFRLSHPLRPVVYATGHMPEEPRQLHGSFFFRKPYRASQIVAAFHRLNADLQLRSAHDDTPVP
jgi:CheY-like chemotaxis protein